MSGKYTESMLEYVGAASSAFQAVAQQAEMLDEAGFIRLDETAEYDIALGGSYYVTRGDSALIAFRLPNTLPERAAIMATHSDAPCFKIKSSPDMGVEDAYVKLNVEPYGVAIYSTWFDRPLSVAGRIFVKDNDGSVRGITVDAGKNLAMIPSLAIHFDRDVNKGHSYDAQKELLPLISLDKNAGIMEYMADIAGVGVERIVSHDLFVYNREKAVTWGINDEFISSPRLDDAACGYASIKALIDVPSVQSLAMHVMFNNEEVGSSSRTGAGSTFLSDTLERICATLGMYGTQYKKMLASSFVLSADNAHGYHPNYPEKSDPTNHVYLGQGIAIKYSGNQKYTTDAESAAYTEMLADKAGIKLQNFHNNSNIAGGSTLGNILTHSLPVLSADIGIAQLAMHSAYETCAASDAEDMYKMAISLYSPV